MIEDPFHPLSCSGTPWTQADALALLDGASSLLLDTATAMVRTRTCPGGTCGAWGEPTVHRQSYLTYSGGSVTRWLTLDSDTHLFLYSASGTPKLSVRHDTHVQKYPSGHADGVVFDVPGSPLSNPLMRVYNHTPVNQYDYRDTENYFGRNATIATGDDCVRVVSVSPRPQDGPATSEIAVVYRF